MVDPKESEVRGWREGRERGGEGEREWKGRKKNRRESEGGREGCPIRLRPLSYIEPMVPMLGVTTPIKGQGVLYSEVPVQPEAIFEAEGSSETGSLRQWLVQVADVECVMLQVCNTIQ